MEFLKWQNVYGDRHCRLFSWSSLPRWMGGWAFSRGWALAVQRNKGRAVRTEGGKIMALRRAVVTTFTGLVRDKNKGQILSEGLFCCCCSKL